MNAGTYGAALTDLKNAHRLSPVEVFHYSLLIEILDRLDVLCTNSQATVKQGGITLRSPDAPKPRGRPRASAAKP